MKKLILLFAILLLPQYAFCFVEAQLKDVGIAKYAVLEAKTDYAPVRVAPDVNSKRFGHIRKGFVLYADKESENFYRVDLGLDKYFWIEKKYAEVQAVIPQKRIQEIKKIEFSQNKDGYEIFIPIYIYNAYSFVEGENSLIFSLYDVNYSDLEIKNLNGAFSLEKNKNSILTVKYSAPALFGYDVTPHKKGMILKIKKAPKINRKKPLKGIKVVLDPGHGGLDPGVCANNLKEKDLNLKIAKQIKKALQKRGAKAYMTRTKDKYVPLYDRIYFAQNKDADILLSIHQNSLPNPKETVKKYGTGTYYYNKQAYALAENIQKSVVEKTGLRDDGVNHASFALTRPTNPVSVLVECGYLINKNDVQKLTDKKFQKTFSKALTEGVENYLRYLIVY